ncbi:MAG TPA: response regulator transcription factor [Acidimicrobiales bacterium]|nr:response regulator transcription factor [Acidimicrobiales bacterium]
MGHKILLVDDEPSIRFLVARGLTAEGYEVLEAGDGEEAIQRLDEEPDLVVLDVVMPKLGGWDVLTEIRRRGELPVIMLTADQGESARIHGLDMGADDYLGKPFSVAELVARVRSVLRRTVRTEVPAVVGAEGLQIEIAARRVLVDGEVVELPRREFELLAFLATHPNRALTIGELLERVWGSSVDWQDKHTVAEHVRRLRQKIGDRWIETVRGVGYRFAPAGVAAIRPARDGLASV